MNRLTKSALSALMLGSALTAQTEPIPAPPVDLEVTFVGSSIEMRVKTPVPMFLGAVIWSLSPELQHSFQGLPPLLAESVVLGVGQGHHGEFRVIRSQRYLHYGLAIYAQGVVADATGIRSSAVVELTERSGEK